MEPRGNLKREKRSSKHLSHLHYGNSISTLSNGVEFTFLTPTKRKEKLEIYLVQV